MKNPVETGDFPPCVNLTDDEIESIRTLTKYKESVLEEKIRLTLINRDQHLLNAFGRVANWCRAYHERIGLGAENRR